MSDARLPINYLDTGRVARDKINDSFNDVVATVESYRPHIENWVWWIWTTNTWVKARGDSIDMKVESWYIRYKSESQTNWTQIIAIEDLKWDKWDPWEDGEDWQDGQDGQDGADWNWITSVTSSKAWKTTTVTMNFDEWDPFSFQVKDWEDGVGGDVFWPASSTDWDVAVFDWNTWKLIKDGSVALSTLSAGAALWATAVQPWDIGTAAACNTVTSSWNVPILDSNWKLATTILPWVALTDTFTVSTSSDLTSLSSAEQWDLAIVTSENKTYVLSAEPYSTAANWKEILAPTWWVTSVNSQTWAVTLDADDISDSTTTNKFVTATDKSTWSWKQDALTLPATPTQWNLVVWGADNETLVDGWAVPTWLPAWWTNWQIIMMVNWAPTWVNPADVWFRLQASDTEIDVPYVWSGTEDQYAARQNYSNDTEYHTF